MFTEQQQREWFGYEPANTVHTARSNKPFTAERACPSSPEAVYWRRIFKWREARRANLRAFVFNQKHAASKPRLRMAYREVELLGELNRQLTWAVRAQKSRLRLGKPICSECGESSHQPRESWAVCLQCG